jgi:hypothetical protein
MKTMQATLHYDRLYRREEAREPPGETVPQISKLSEAVTWAVLGFCLAGWAVVGLFLWIPRVLRAVLVFSVSLIHATLTETSAEAAGRSLRSAADFYRRGFASAVESIRPPTPEAERHHDDDPRRIARVQPGPIIRETAWAIVVWYIVVWSTGLLQGTPADLAAVPWSDLWLDAVEAVASITDLFRR